MERTEVELDFTPVISAAQCSGGDILEYNTFLFDYFNNVNIRLLNELSILTYYNILFWL